MKTFFIIVLCTLFFIFNFIFFLKKWYSLLAIKKVYIPNFLRSRKEFISDEPLKLLKKKKNNIMIFNIIYLTIMFVFFYSTYAFYISISCFLITYPIAYFTFNRNIFEYQIFDMFSNYLTK